MATASVTYTPQQLNQLVNAGQYPDQQSPSTMTESVSFGECLVRVESIMSAIRDYYPVRTVVDTSIVYTVKAWVNDAAITTTCSNPDSTRVITQASYR